MILRGIRICGLMALSFSALLVSAQDRENASITTAFAVLTSAVDSKTASVGQQVTFRTLNNVVVRGELVIPAGSIIIAHINDVREKGKDQPQSALAIVIDKAVRPDKREINLQAIIAAIAAPRDNSLTSDPAYAMLHSNEPKMVGNGAGNTSSSGDLSPSSKASSNAAVATADLKGRMDEPLLLKEDSQGAIGYEGLTMSWSLATPPPFTIFVSKNKNIKISAASQVLLRMAPPRLPQ